MLAFNYAVLLLVASEQIERKKDKKINKWCKNI